MSDDPAYEIIDYAKSNIDRFIRAIEKLSDKNQFVFTIASKSFFRNIAKHILFFKQIDLIMPCYFYKVIISDLYNLIVNLVEGQVRYAYLDERSIIENYTRAIINDQVHDGHITSQSFEALQGKKYSFDFLETDFSFIKSEYRTSCAYIHGSTFLNPELSTVLCECVGGKHIRNINKYFNRIMKLLKIYDQLLISSNGESINGSFHREKVFFEYLLGKEMLELLFKTCQ
ncbi:hypothetical protein AB840_05965 [Megasphaera cerevisiae DSM 20462]|uniref:Uncharacterized protein n=2 Tax=Megasphaera TaxID=906 RepID=A0A0J6WTK5_9FIRM|nr:hypothetical protein AB840_05965 [Megasphaera cerevisiae DSM 20462]